MAHPPSVVGCLARTQPLFERGDSVAQELEMLRLEQPTEPKDKSLRRQIARRPAKHLGDTHQLSDLVGRAVKSHLVGAGLLPAQVKIARGQQPACHHRLHLPGAATGVRRIENTAPLAQKSVQACARARQALAVGCRFDLQHFRSLLAREPEHVAEDVSDAKLAIQRQDHGFGATQPELAREGLTLGIPAAVRFHVQPVRPPLCDGRTPRLNTMLGSATVAERATRAKCCFA